MNESVLARGYDLDQRISQTVRQETRMRSY